MLGRLLINRRAGESLAAWNRPNLQATSALTVTSEHFANGGPIPIAHTARAAGGDDLSPHLAWSAPPEGTAQLLLVVEDVDVPLKTPAVHCLAVIAADGAEGAGHRLGAGELSGRHHPSGVRLLRSTIGRGYHGPAPVKGHGPHRYTFQLFALGEAIDASSLHRAGPRRVLNGLTAPVLARGRLVGTYER